LSKHDLGVGGWGGEDQGVCRERSVGEQHHQHTRCLRLEVSGFGFGVHGARCRVCRGWREHLTPSPSPSLSLSLSLFSRIRFSISGAGRKGTLTLSILSKQLLFSRNRVSVSRVGRALWSTSPFRACIHRRGCSHSSLRSRSLSPRCGCRIEGVGFMGHLPPGCLQDVPYTQHGRPGGNPGANGWFIESNPMKTLPRTGGICGRLTSDLTST
jgi:hypothetical protein